MPLKVSPNLILYFIFSFTSLFFIDVQELAIEMVLKLCSTFFLCFYYLNNSKRINYWYLTLLLSSMASDSFLVFDAEFLLFGTLLIVLNRVLYIIILREFFLRLNY